VRSKLEPSSLSAYLLAQEGEAAMPAEQRFAIEGLTPETLSMERLAEYLGELARLLEHKEAVHFRSVEPGSAVLKYCVEDADAAKITLRLAATEAGEGPDDAGRAYRMLNRKLAQDRATARVIDQVGTVIIRFPGCEAAPSEAFGPFTQRGSLEGMIVKVGGLDETAHVALEDRGTHWVGCQTTREIASELGRYLYQGRVRVHGVGRWRRDQAGAWHLDRFRIESFEPLAEASLAETVARLRAVPGSEWPGLPDPWAALRSLREDEGTA
jgi:hypothetical protein